jgi:hypothetical protein
MFVHVFERPGVKVAEVKLTRLFYLQLYSGLQAENIKRKRKQKQVSWVFPAGQVSITVRTKASFMYSVE